MASACGSEPPWNRRKVQRFEPSINSGIFIERLLIAVKYPLVQINTLIKKLERHFITSITDIFLAQAEHLLR